VLGVVLPGITGVPFSIAAIAMVALDGPKLLRWAGPEPVRFICTGLRQLGQWLDDLERRDTGVPPVEDGSRGR
jgi:hypothetical protein